MDHGFRFTRTHGLAFAALALALGFGLSGCNQQSPTSAGKATDGLSIDSPNRLGVPVSNPRGASRVVAELAAAYREQSERQFLRLLSADVEEPFLFSGKSDVWGKVEERRIASRMFDPQAQPPGDTPVPAELWVQSIATNFKQLTRWVESPEFYRSDANPNGLDPARWRATEAQYRTIVLVETQGETDFRIDGKQSFVVIEDLHSALGSAPSFFLYRWRDLGPASASKQQSLDWVDVKNLYR